MLSFIYRKIMRSGWKTICLVIGSVLAVGVFITIPLFTNGILQRTLTRDLQLYQDERNVFPGYVTLLSRFSSSEWERIEQYQQLTEIAEQIPLMLDIPLIDTVNSIIFDSFLVSDRGRNQFGIQLRSGFENNIDLIHGRMYTPGVDPDTGAYEVMVTETSFRQNLLTLDTIYAISPSSFSAETEFDFVKIVGVFEPHEETPYWQSLSHLNTFFMPYDSLDEMIQSRYAHNMRRIITFVFDYNEIKIEQVETILAALENSRRYVTSSAPSFGFALLNSNFESTLENFVAREEGLRFLLQILYAPVFIMLFYYIFMVAQLRLESEESVIAVLKSRGASAGQILRIYFIEVLILGGISVIIGIPLGWGMCRVLGLSNGFLDFVMRSALPLRMSFQIYSYAAVAFCLIVLTTLAPAFAFSRTSIVEQKHKKARKRKPFWKLIFLDVILLFVSLYYLYRMREQTDFYGQLNIAGTEGGVDPIIYIASTVFIVGAGLCFLRIYPILISLVYRIGKRIWTPVPYAALNSILNSGGKEVFLMLFTILALSIGLFNADAARSINRNIEDRIHISYGADIITRQHWVELGEDGRPLINIPDGYGRLPDAPVSGSTNRRAEEPSSYLEPPFMDFKMLDNVTAVARVLQLENIRVSAQIHRTSAMTGFMAFDPYDFAQTTWWRNDLTPHHLNEYMNILMEYPTTAILSTSLRDELRIREGDRVNIEMLPFGGFIQLDVIAFVDYWPTYSPYSFNSSDVLVQNHLVVANLDYLFSEIPRYPYNVWINKMPDVADGVIFEQLDSMRTPFKSIETVTKSIVAAKNDPVLQGSNGAFSLVFIITMLISVMGFLIFWILNINSRVLQFGVFRAMGLSKGRIFAMIVWEQILTSGVAIVVGVIIGNIAVSLFLPIFSLLYTGVEQSVPFRIHQTQGDLIRILSIYSALLLVCLIILGYMLRRIKIDQTIKLGED